jgi:hypothetical protein
MIEKGTIGDDACIFPEVLEYSGYSRISVSDSMNRTSSGIISGYNGCELMKKLSIFTIGS